MTEEYEVRVKVNAYLFGLVRERYMRRRRPTHDQVDLYIHGYREVCTIGPIKWHQARFERKVAISHYFPTPGVKVCWSYEHPVLLHTRECMQLGSPIVTRQRTRWVHGSMALTYVAQVAGPPLYEMEIEFDGHDPCEPHKTLSRVRELMSTYGWPRYVLREINSLFTHKPSGLYLSVKFNQPVSVTQEVLDGLQQTAKHIRCTKYDGVRQFLFCNSRGRQYLLTHTRIDRLNVSSAPRLAPVSLYDVELMPDGRVVFLDVLVHGGQRTDGLPTGTRLGMLPPQPQGHWGTDGYVYKNAQGDYMSKAYKLKETVTVDFLLVPTTNETGTYAACVASKSGLVHFKDTYVQVYPSAMQCSETGIAEFVFYADGTFEFLRLRDDKLVPNYIDVVEKNMAIVLAMKKNI